MKKVYALLLILMISTTLQAQWNPTGMELFGDSIEDFHGWDISMSADGNTLAAGATQATGSSATEPGYVRVYNWNGSSWSPKGNRINGKVAGDAFGHGVSLSANGDILAIGAEFNEDSGSQAGQVQIYEWNGTAWSQRGSDINGHPINSAQFGSRVSMSSNGDLFAASSIWGLDTAGVSTGHVRIFEWTGSDWAQKGLNIDGETGQLNSLSGWDIALNSIGNTLVYGAIYALDSAGISTGHARVFEWNGSAWVQKGADLDGEGNLDQFGMSVSIDSTGNTIAVGGDLNSGGGVQAGHVRVFDWNGSSWIQRGQDIDGESAGDGSGKGVSLNSDGNILAIGAPRNNDGDSSAGHVRVFEWDGQSWLQQGMDIDGNSSAELSGWEVFLNSPGTRVAIGSPWSNDGGSKAGQVTVFDFCSVDTGVTFLSPTELSSNASGPGITYQWIDCSNNSAIAGANSQTFTPIATGDYSVVVDDNGCVDTSACNSVIISGIGLSDFGNGLKLYPNPSKGDFSLDLGADYENIELTIRDLSGKVLQHSQHFNTNQLKISFASSEGLYLLSLKSEEKTATIRFTVQ